jgi:predicted CoA-binding protein
VGAKVLWLQEGIVNDDARRIAEDAGLTVIMGVCIRVAHGVIDEREG